MTKKINKNSIEVQSQRQYRSHFFGIDFSGGKEPGNKIWVCEAIYTSKRIFIKDIYSLLMKYKFQSRQESYKYLVELIKENPDGVFGFDFPFSLPAIAVKSSTWRNFIIDFNNNYRDENEFRNKLRVFFNKKDVKRECDIISKAPFSPYNLRIFRQTYFGISEVLKPIVLQNKASILPFSEPIKGKSIVMEVCPASLLKRYKESIKSFLSYKGKGDAKRRNRSEILDFFSIHSGIEYSDFNYKNLILEDTEGDALDCLLCVVCSLSGLSDLKSSKNDENYLLEGYIYY